MLDTVEQFDTLGFISHPSKLAFEPSQTLVILGFRLDSVKMTISLTDRMLQNTHEIKKNGKITSSLPGVMFGVLYHRAIEKR